jgi:signal transduction histidine kinase
MEQRVGHPQADIWRGQRNRFLMEDGHNKRSHWIRPAGMLVNACTLAILCDAGYSTWRILALGATFVAFSIGHALWFSRVREETSFDRILIGVNLTSQTMVTISCGLTGGLHSPLIPALLLPSVISLLFFGPHAVARWMAFASALQIAAMACLPQDVVGPMMPAHPFAIALVVNLGWNFVMLHAMVGKMTRAATKAGYSMACMRDERLSDAEAGLRRLQGVGAKVAHELKNPLASIKGLCQLVSRAPESERTQERLAVVASEISRMETILNEYLSFSRPLEDLRPESLDLAGIARDVLDTLAGRAENAGVTLSLEGGATNVMGDSRRLKEALINLVANAIEATPNGGRVALRLRLGPGAVILEVRDTGRGISAEDLERLGTSFFTTRPNGTGLGVVLAQGVINQHGGTLAYQSTVGAGTTATITLPVKTAAAAGSPAAAPSARAAMVEARA